MPNSLGASADAETGSRASHQAPSGLDPSGFDPARKRREERNELRYRSEMRRSSHRRWQRAREWDGGWTNPVPDGAPVSVWRKGGCCWHFHRYADRVDWTTVRAYRLEHGTPYPDPLGNVKRVSPELVGTLPPVLQFRFDRIEATLARLEAVLATRDSGGGQ